LKRLLSLVLAVVTCYLVFSLFRAIDARDAVEVEGTIISADDVVRNLGPLGKNASTFHLVTVHTELGDFDGSTPRKRGVGDQVCVHLHIGRLTGHQYLDGIETRRGHDARRGASNGSSD
jgi:hypothetical protein